MDLAIPFRELINVVTLAQALIFAVVLLTARFRGALSNRILIFSFFVIATVKFDQLYQLLGGLQSLPSFGFVFTPVQWLLTPSLYFFVRAKLDDEFQLRPDHLWHLLPATASLIYLSLTYFSLPVEGKVEFIQSGALADPLNALVIPLVSDCIQLGYLLAALSVLATHGVTLRDWFSRIDAGDLLWTRRVLMLWIAAFLMHITFTVSLRVFEWYSIARIVLDGLNVTHLLLVNALMILGVVGQFSSIPTAGRREKYSTSDQTPDERQALYLRVQAEMINEAHYLKMDLDLGELADAVAATPRDLSEAINGEGAVSFYEFVSGYRLEAAKRLLREEPDTQILEIAHRAGFNSKSTFNKVFKEITGQTPSEFRRVAHD